MRDTPCPRDTDRDGDCAWCARRPGGCTWTQERDDDAHELHPAARQTSQRSDDA